MKGALGFFGVFLSFLSDVSGSDSPHFEYGNSSLCQGYGSICDDHFGGPTMNCLLILMDLVCLETFQKAMNSMNNSDWCIWGSVNSLYGNLSECTEQISDCLQIPWPNWLVEQKFVDIHSTFFQECPVEEFIDPPPHVIFALVITPICLIPVMVGLVVLKTKNGDSSS